MPEVVLDHPEAVAQLHRDFVHAGSDVVEAFTYYGHREKMRIVGKEHLLEALNRQALEIAKGVAAETGTLVAGNTCNTNLYLDESSASTVREMFREQVGWAAEAEVDYVIAETFSHFGEALVALEVIKEAGLTAVITLTVHQSPLTRDGLELAEACRRLEDAGADVVGLNCCRGPATMLPLLGPIREAVTGHLAALPVPYRTHDDQPTFQALREDGGADGAMPFPTALDPFTCTRYEIAEFAREAQSLGVDYFGLCCGAGPHHLRSLAEALGRTPPASAYSPDMSKHAYLGSDETLQAENVEFAKDL